MIENFPCWRLSDQGWRDFFKLLLNPPVNNVNPEASIPVWSGQQIFVPGKRQKIIFLTGLRVSIHGSSLNTDPLQNHHVRRSMNSWNLSFQIKKSALYFWTGLLGAFKMKVLSQVGL